MFTNRYAHVPPVRPIAVTPECEHLDAFLLSDLPPAAVVRFEAHLATCADCHEAVEEQRWIDGLLQSDATATLEPAPPSLTTLPTLNTRRRQVTRYVGPLITVAAALLIAVFGWQLIGSRENETMSPKGGNLAKNAASRPSAVPVLAGEPGDTNRARFVNRSDTIALSIESDDDNVSIVQLVPTTQTDRRIRNEFILRALELDSNGG